MTRGVYAIDRGVFEHPFFKNERFTEREAWIWLLGEAAWRATRVRVNRVQFDLHRGQLVHAIRFMAAKWKWSEPRVRRYLARAKRDGMVEVSATSDATLITICNYDEYQFARRAGDEPATSPRRREEEDNNLGGDSVPPAREPRRSIYSAEAIEFAAELATISGHDPEFLPPSWVSAGPILRIQMMLDAGWHVAVMRDAAKAAMHRKSDGPPASIKYFEKIFARAHQPQLPLPKVQVVGGTHVQAGQSGNAVDWKARRDAGHSARAKLRTFLDRAQPASDGGAGGDGPVVQLVRDTGRR